MLRTILCLCMIVLALLNGCTTEKQTPDQIRRKTAQTTAEIKQEATAVAEGIREGLSSDKVIDLNSASRSQILSLPGLTGEQADRIIAGRPYRSTDELLSRGIVPKSEYDQIASRIIVKK